MRVDVHALDAFRRVADEGAESAAASLSQLVDVDAHVDVTNVTLVTPSDVVASFTGTECAGVEMEFQGPPSGNVLLAFDAGSVDGIENLLRSEYVGAEDDALVESGITEAASLVMNGFVDGWANHLGVAIESTPPTYVEPLETPFEATGRAPADGDRRFAFETKMEASNSTDGGVTIRFRISVLLAAASADEFFGPETQHEGVPIDELSTFAEMTKRGAQRAATNVGQMTGMETELEVSRVRFVPIEDAPTQVDDGTYVGTVFRLDGLPSGYLAVLFDEPSAESVAATLLGATPPFEWDGMERSAIEELGNIVTSGLIDGWANALETTIEHTPPSFVHDDGAAIMSPIAGRLSRTQEHAFILDSKVTTAGEAVSFEVYVLPDETELKEALESLPADGAEGFRREGVS